MNLDVMTKTDIINRAIAGGFDRTHKDLIREENEIGMACYADVFDAAEVKLAEKLPKSWLRYDAYLRFNVRGYDLRLTVKKSMPVPYSNYCNRLGSVKDEALIERTHDFAKRKQQFESDREKTRIRLDAMLKTIRTLKRLEELWPDGKPFYKHLIGTEKASVPAVRFEEINKALGLVA